MVKLSSIMDLSEVAVAGRPLSTLLQESLRDAHEQLRDQDGDADAVSGGATSGQRDSTGA